MVLVGVVLGVVYRSDVLWEVEKAPKHWKAVEQILSKNLEEIYNEGPRNEVYDLSEGVAVEFMPGKEVMYLLLTRKCLWFFVRFFSTYLGVAESL